MGEHQASGQFEIYMLTDRLIDILPYNYEDQNWRKLLDAPPPGKVILTDEDIETYNWEDQEIILTPTSSERLIELSLIEKTFIAYLGKKLLFGGSFIEQGSARAIKYPVIYIDKSKPQVVLQLRPLHVIFESYHQLEMKIKRRIELSNVKHHFRILGKLR